MKTFIDEINELEPFPAMVLGLRSIGITIYVTDMVIGIGGMII